MVREKCVNGILLNLSVVLNEILPHPAALPGWRHLESSGDIFGCHSWKSGVLLASSGWRPGVLLNTLQHAEQTPTKKNHAAQNVNSAEVKKLCSES